MEENASDHLTARFHDGEAFVYARGDQFTNIVFGGVNFNYDMTRPAGERVVISGFHNGRDFDEDGVYLVVVNNYFLGNDRCGLRNYSADDAVWSQLTDAAGEAIQDIITDYIRQRTSENGAVTPADFDWHWQIVCRTETGELPAFDGIVGAKLAALPENGNRYVIYNEAQGCMLTARPTDGGLGAAACPAAGAVLPAPLPENAVVFTAHAMADGSYQFTDAGGNYLVSGAKVAALSAKCCPRRREYGKFCSRVPDRVDSRNALSTRFDVTRTEPTYHSGRDTRDRTLNIARQRPPRGGPLHRAHRSGVP